MLLKVESVSEVATLKSLRSSRLVNFISGLFSKIKLITMSIASDNGIFVNRLVTSNELKNLSDTLTDSISSIKVKLQKFVEYSNGI